MLRIGLAVGLSAILFSGCTTTEKMISKVTPTNTPLQQVLKAHSEILKNPVNFSIRQVFNNVESATAAQVVVIESGLMDDSVAAIRVDYTFKLINHTWKIQGAQKSYKCARGKNTQNFQKALCA